MAALLSVNVGRPQQLSVRRGRPLMSAIGKAPVEDRVRVEGVNVAGDDQADRRVHGGPDKAVYAYAREDAAFWEAELGRELAPGAFGENLTTEGLDVTGAVVGERWRIGTVELEVCQPRLPVQQARPADGRADDGQALRAGVAPGRLSAHRGRGLAGRRRRDRGALAARARHHRARRHDRGRALLPSGQ